MEYQPSKCRKPYRVVIVRPWQGLAPKNSMYRVRPGAYGCRSAEIYENAFSTEDVNMGRREGFL